MHASAELIITNVLDQHPAQSDDVDLLAERYLEAEKAAAEAYRIALAIDQPHERLKEQLILLADDLGIPEEPHTKLLRGSAHEVRVRYCVSAAPDPEAVRIFANRLRRNGVRGLFPQVFEGKIAWKFRNDAEEFLKRVRLHPDLLDLYQRCRRIDSVPTLEVIPCRDVCMPRRDNGR